ncbi:transposase [uncultured Gammaproteobacteria bacterium]
MSRRLRGYRTDRLYQSETITGRPVLLYTLIEHKSSSDQRTPLQLLGYQVEILESWDRREGRNQDSSLRPLPVVITLVIYNGATEWNAPFSFAEATDADPALRPYILDFRYNLVDLGRIPDAKLSQERALRVGLLILKHGSLRRANRKKLLKIAREAMALGHEDLAMFLYYLLADLIDDPKGELARGLVHELIPEQEERMMSLIAEQLKTEGFNLGIAKGRVEGKVEGKAEGKADTLLRQLSRRFKTLPAGVEERVRAAGMDQLNEWLDRILDAQTLDDVFGSDPRH